MVDGAATSPGCARSTFHGLSSTAETTFSSDRARVNPAGIERAHRREYGFAHAASCAAQKAKNRQIKGLRRGLTHYALGSPSVLPPRGPRSYLGGIYFPRQLEQPCPFRTLPLAANRDRSNLAASKLRAMSDKQSFRTLFPT